MKIEIGGKKVEPFDKIGFASAGIQQDIKNIQKTYGK